MKNLALILFAALSLSASAQRKVGGFYSGTLFNDTTKMLQKYELALAEYRGNITGYSYVTFVSNDTFYWGIRKVKAAVVGDSLIVEDDKIVANNFPKAPARRIGRIITIPLNGQDSLVRLNGRWRTNQTKTYYSIPGSIDLERSTDSTHSPLIRHLRELGIIAEPNYAATEAKVKIKDDKTKIKTVNKPDVTKATNERNPVPLPYTERKTRWQETIEVSTDSLVLSFYDNGVVDGDSISVYLNGQNIISHTRLLSVATKKTVSIAGMEQIELLLVAENLGSIPPNTGLITIRDGEQLYQLNFTADMQSNASVIIRRKRR